MTEDHNYKRGGVACKKIAKLKVFKKEIFTSRISYQGMVQELVYIFIDQN